MTNQERLNLATKREMTVTADEAARVAEIQARIPGWSNCAHYAFFRELLMLPISRILVLGVYHGRDMALMSEVLRRSGSAPDVHIVGVDRFTADPCADWQPTNKPRTWEQETNGCPPPSFEAAKANLAHDPRFHVIKQDDFSFLESTDLRFDAIYLDTSHDYNTLVRQLRQVRRILTPGGVICGDDFSDQYTWGVKSAVEDTFKNYLLFAGWIWAAFLEDSK